MAEKATIVVFSGDLDKVLAAFVIATGCAAQGMEVTMFYTFWGLNVVKKDKGPIAGAKNWMQKMMGMMNRGGISRLPLSKFNMAGMGRSMMKKLMKKTNVASLSEMLAMARDLDVKMWACKMSMDVMGVAKEDLIPEVDKIVGVAAYAAEAQQSKINLFI
ncbi:MAG TPA: DsrE/DsrF/DrsH-like family protein [Caldisericia bacterium]|nr:DsrE/DsrF/DrsH-like family protein [Caldisericia bacterium]HOU07611.1 DsrE/DsrF/DrsH-like family protein [Caldisericia bacterium]HPL88910.1 DsrE/DsrF/DrsH-like family protein [Caldisericia bacterium]HQG59047.1 DsrE/DsrF/DrsH-like family protein [Caldisericia bacterium]HQH49386.1 DsrE/DsrF/DrsH-like family protein [Caldisericia bacterium]